ncbi:MAG: uncharacterized protein QOG53_665 [Frankiales bacterium]|nr:uncharacterized protein [Frankiales bacterium]
MLARTGLIQIDSVNVLLRAQYMPGWSRLGAYPRDLLDAMVYRHRELFEYWGHEAALLPVELQPLMRWRMHRAEHQAETWGGIARLAKERPDYIKAVLKEVSARGPVTAGDLEKDSPRRTGNWGWNWADSKFALEYLFWSGKVMTASRKGFERVYDVTERVLPPAIQALPTPTEEEAHHELLLIAARCHGVGTVADLADYFRLTNPQARPRIAELVDEGRLLEVAVEGWRHPAYVLPGTTIPRNLSGRALLAPFDPLVWARDRVERLWGFRYRIEIYVPAAKRMHGYYVLPFLLGDQLVARVDLKSDRAAGVLRVQAAYTEPGIDKAAVTTALVAELTELADWLGLTGVTWTGRGDLALTL